MIKFVEIEHNKPLCVRMLNLDNIIDNISINMIGKLGSGILWVTRDIIKHLQKMGNNIKVISQCKIKKDFYSDFIPFIHIYNNLQKGTEIDSFIVMDNCFEDYNKYITAGYLLTLPIPTYIIPNVKCNIDYIFLFWDDNIQNQKKMYEYYGDIFLNFEYFLQIYEKLTKNYGTLIIANKCTSSNIEDKIFYYNPYENKIQN